MKQKYVDTNQEQMAVKEPSGNLGNEKISLRLKIERTE